MVIAFCSEMIFGLLLSLPMLREAPLAPGGQGACSASLLSPAHACVEGKGPENLF